MRKSWLALLILLAWFSLIDSRCDNDNNMTGPVATVTPVPATSTPTPVGTSTATPVLTSTPTPTRTVSPTPTPTSLAAAFAGNYSGQWVNNTFSTTGSANLAVTVDTNAQTFQATLTLGGSVFGAGTPGPQTLSGSYSSFGGTITQTTPLFGNVTLNINPMTGGITGNCTNLPNPNISRIDFTGTGTPQRITINYTITFTSAGGGGTATGAMTLNHL